MKRILHLKKLPSEKNTYGKIRGNIRGQTPAKIPPFSEHLSFSKGFCFKYM